MVALREYVLSVSAAALLSGVICSICGNQSFSGAAVKLVCGMMLTLVVMRPLIRIRITDLEQALDSVRSAGQLQAQEGVDYASQAMMQLIKDKTAAYILDKAEQFHASVQVEVGVTDDRIPIPDHVTIEGDISPYAKTKLQEYLESELGIPRENQRWIR